MPEILICDDDTTTRKMLRGILESGGFTVSTAADGEAALRALQKKKFDLVLLDVWIPKISGLDLLELLRDEPYIPKIVVITSDQTSETLLRALRGRVFQFVSKPIDAQRLLGLINDALSAEPSSPPIEVLSATPSWVELLVPCQQLVVPRVQSFLSHLESDLSQAQRDSIGLAFRELLNNAIEWGGRLDPNQKVRISYIRTQRAVIYRIDDPGPGFRLEDLDHAAINNPEDDPMAHTNVRAEKGLRPGGLGLLLTKSLVDELIYNEARNAVVLIKYL